MPQGCITALHLAAGGQHEACVGTLLGQGAKCDEVTHEGMTPLHIAAGHGYLSICQRLLDSGASTAARTRQGDTPAAVARKMGKRDVATMLELVRPHTTEFGDSAAPCTQLYAEAVLGDAALRTPGSHLIQGAHCTPWGGEVPESLAACTGSKDRPRLASPDAVQRRQGSAPCRRTGGRLGPA